MNCKLDEKIIDTLKVRFGMPPALRNATLDSYHRFKHQFVPSKMPGSAIIERQFEDSGKEIYPVSLPQNIKNKYSNNFVFYTPKGNSLCIDVNDINGERIIFIMTARDKDIRRIDCLIGEKTSITFEFI